MDLKNAKKYILTRLENELADNLYYHGIHHTIDVHEAAIRIAEAEKVNTEEKSILQTAALFHDAGFIQQYESNEVIAVELINKVLPSFNYTPQEIKTIGEIILTTRVKARPSTLLEKIMCDADYDYLGRNEAKKIADSLYRELQEYGTSLTEKEWIQFQIKFLNKHEYYTNTSIQLRRENKWEYIRYLKGLK